MRWADVDFEGEQITIGADGLAKNHESRVVEFNAKLGAHVREMFQRRQPASLHYFCCTL